MKKKILSILFAVLLITGVTATPIFQIGPTVEFAKPYFAIEDSFSFEDFTKQENYSLGLDTRLNVLFLQIGLSGLYGNIDDGHNLSALLSCNILIKPVGKLTLSLGMGASIDFYTKDFQKFYVNSTVVDNFVDILKESPLYYRAQVGYDFGKIGLSLSYNLPTKGSISNFNTDTMMPNLKNGKFRMSLLFNF